MMKTNKPSVNKPPKNTPKTVAKPTGKSQPKPTEGRGGDPLALENLPQLVQRLLINTTNHDYLTMLQGQGNRLDIEYHSQHLFMPTGRTYCIMSGDVNYEQDLIDLYNSVPKSINKARTNFVFITNQVINNKARVINRLRHVRQWQSLVLIDQKDLNEWLDKSISAKVWLQEKINQPLSDIKTGAKWWTHWATLTNKQSSEKQPFLIKPSLLFKNNQAMQKTKTQLLQQIELNQYISVAWDSCHLSLAFVLACLQSSPRTYQNTVIIDDYDTYSKSWRLFNSNVIVILNFEHNNMDDIINGLENTKSIIHICGQSDPVNRGDQILIDVPHLYHKDVSSWLNDNLPRNHEFKEEVLKSNHQYGSSLTILRHLCGIDAKTSTKWLPHGDKAEKFMLTAMLIGQWKDEQGNRNNDYKDIEFIQQLLGDEYAYDDFIEYLEPLQNAIDYPIAKTPSYMDSDTDNDNVWYLTSLKEIWFLMQPYLDYTTWSDFKSVARDALTSEQISPYLKRGLLYSLIFYSMPEYQNGHDYHDQIAELIDQILQADSLDLDEDLIILGEIAPQEIIDFIDSDLEHFNKPALLALFWHPHYSKQVIEILLRSYKIDHEAKLLNKIFQPFRLHTYTSYTQMLETLANHISDPELYDLVMQILLNQIPLSKTMEFKNTIPPQWQFKTYVRDIPNNIKVRQGDFIKIFETIATNLHPDLNYYSGLFDALWAEFIPLNWKQYLFKAMQSKQLLSQFNTQQQLALYNDLRQRINAYHAKGTEYQPDQQTFAEFQKFFDLIAPDDYRKDLWIFDAPSTEILNDETANSEEDRQQALNIIIPIFERMYSQCQSNLHETLSKMPELSDLNIARLYKVISNSEVISQSQKDSLINDFDSDDKLLDALAGSMIKGNVYADLNNPNYEFLAKAYSQMENDEKRLKLLFLMWVIDDGLVQFIANREEQIQQWYWDGLPYNKLGEVSDIKVRELLKHDRYQKTARWFASSDRIAEVPNHLIYQFLNQYAPIFNDIERETDESTENQINIAIVKIFNQIYQRPDIDIALISELERQYLALSLTEYFDKINKVETYGGAFPKFTMLSLSTDTTAFLDVFNQYYNDLQQNEDNRKDPIHYHLLHKWAGITNLKNQANSQVIGHGENAEFQTVLCLEWFNKTWAELPQNDEKLTYEFYNLVMNNLYSYGLNTDDWSIILPVWDMVINENDLPDDVVANLKTDLYGQIVSTTDAKVGADDENHNMEMIQFFENLSDNCPDGFSHDVLDLILQSYKADAKTEKQSYTNVEGSNLHEELSTN